MARTLMKLAVESADAEKLRNYLTRLEMSVRALALAVEVTDNTAYRWVHGKRRVPGAVLAYLRLRIEVSDWVTALRRVVHDEQGTQAGKRGV